MRSSPSLGLLLVLASSACNIYLDDDPHERHRGDDDECSSSDYDDCEVVTPETCSADDDCATGEYCDDSSWRCVVSDECQVEADCGHDYDCDLERDTCVPEPPPCDSLTDEASCFAAPTCEPRYRGIDCSSPVEASCTDTTECDCESFVFTECVDAP